MHNKKSKKYSKDAFFHVYKIKCNVFCFTVFVILMIFAWMIVNPFRISGDCMEPAISDGKIYFCNKLSAYLRHYKIGDIVAFKHENKVWISRIVALEDDTIQITEKQLIVNNHLVNEPKILRNWENWNYGTYAIQQPLIVPKNHVFVLSDNLCCQHDDSRVFGCIHQSSLVGLIW